MKTLRHSLVAHIVTFLLAISGMAITNIGLTMLIAQSSEGDAAAINVAGSLRLNAAQIAEALKRPADDDPDKTTREVNQLAERLSTRLESPALEQGLPYTRNEKILEQLNALKSQWQQMLALKLDDALNGDENEVTRTKAALNSFIHDIDQFVYSLESSTEAKIRLLSTVQILFLALISLLLLIALYDIRHNLVTPLRQLMILSREAAHRNFHYRSHFMSQDELGQLGRTFDKMAAELGRSYHELEARVSHKQDELKRQNRALHIIHNGSRTLYGGGNDLCASAAPMFHELEKLLDIGPMVLSLNNEHDGNEMEIIATHSSERPRYCRDLDCFSCLEAPQKPLEFYGDEAPHADTVGETLVLPVAIGHSVLGHLSINYATPLSPSTRQMLNTLVDHLATAIHLQHRIAEQQQLSLIKERTIIARELHDSLAQSLSYLKMQVARLERMQIKQLPIEQQQGVIHDLREGLNSAYRQLRELLSTFRLSLDKPGLQPALQQTVDEFSAHLGFPVELTYQVPPHILSANEEVHLLQIVREALTNTLKHARAHWAKVSLTFQRAELHLAIEDDGIGLTDDKSPPMHYGLIIMRDRAYNIDATLNFKNRSEGGTGVYVCFIPQTDRLIEEGDF
ncbi:histidine kinase [Vreelandella salicampi]|uniref:Sensor protein n=1 Tax=Vreelandella salicampi TaxID=1449798 RepID=A0A7Z0LP59_9GAMM|nr:type IV pili methyl-accepting chemotaxis transducer N-terminal domain-containing protein [Halomonas salicampi]NYS62561.1 type IV pili methyl-accepting chemotaxis transducer N-terminal domain-containing protein [Halomonas salicampi]